MYTVVTNQSSILSSILVPLVVGLGILSLWLVMYLAMVYPGSTIIDPAYGAENTVDWIDVPFAKNDLLNRSIADGIS